MVVLPEPINHTVTAIYEAYERTARHGDGRGVAMSDAANECERAIWYKLRWAVPGEKTDGRKERIFETGRIEEDRLLDNLESAGLIVERVDPATGKQFSVSLARGWLRGKLDGRATGVIEAPKTVHVVECKSHNEKSFKELSKKKLRDGKPDHFAQCQLYTHAEQITRCLYIAVNKNTDELYIERIEYDAGFALTLEAKIERIVRTDRAPSRLHDDPTSKAAFACGRCRAYAQCHEAAFSRMNCRTCIHASFEDGAEVRCVRLDKILSYKEQQDGCDQHRYLPDLVPGEQVDVAGDVIVYRMNDGSEWRDGVK